MQSGCSYRHIDEDGLYLLVGNEPRLLAVDNLISCAGQHPLRKIIKGLNLPYQLSWYNYVY